MGKVIQETKKAVHPDRWFLGLRQTGERSLSEEERKGILGRLRLARHRLLRTLGFLALAPLWFFLLAGGMGGEDLPLLHALGSLASRLLLFLGVPIGLLCLRDLSRASRKLRADLLRGRVLCFEGELEEGGERARKVLKRLGLLRGEGGECLEVLPASSLVFRANGRPVPPGIQGRMFEAVSPPAKPWITRLPEDFPMRVLKPGIQVRRRRLERAEGAELQRHMEARFAFPVGLALAVLCFAALVGLGGRRPGYHVLGDPASLFALCLSVLGSLCYLQDLWTAKRMEEDLDWFWVLTVKEIEEGGRDPEAVEGAPRVEILPCSKLVWTDEGRPARWRRA